MNGSAAPMRALTVLGGIGLIVTSFLDWREAGEPYIVEGTVVPLGKSGWELGMLGLWQTIIGAILVLAGLAAVAGAADKLPDSLLGFGFDHALIMLAVAPLLWNFALQFDQIYGGLGLLLGWVSAAAAIAGTLLASQLGSAAAS